MPQGLGKTGSNKVNTPKATHSKIFQKEDKVPGQKSKASITVPHISALKRCAINYLMSYELNLAQHSQRQHFKMSNSIP